MAPKPRHIHLHDLSGRKEEPAFTLAGNSRKTYALKDKIPSGRAAGTDTIGGYSD